MPASSARSLWIALTVAALLAGWYRFLGPGRRSELGRIESILGRLSGVGGMDISWVEERLEFFPLLSSIEHIGATLEVKGKGTLSLVGLDSTVLSGSGPLYLGVVGPHKLRTRGGRTLASSGAGHPLRTEFASLTPDVSPQGEFAALFPFSIDNVQTLIDRYDDVLAVFAGLSAGKATPWHIRDDEGTDWYFWVAPSGSDGPMDPLWNLPLAELRAAALEWPQKADRASK